MAYFTKKAIPNTRIPIPILLMIFSPINFSRSGCCSKKEGFGVFSFLEEEANGISNGCSIFCVVRSCNTVNDSIVSGNFFSSNAGVTGSTATELTSGEDGFATVFSSFTVSFLMNADSSCKKSCFLVSSLLSRRVMSRRTLRISSVMELRIHKSKATIIIIYKISIIRELKVKDEK